MTAPKWALVPVEADEYMLTLGRRERSKGGHNRDVYDAMISASPGADLLARIIKARDAFYYGARSWAQLDAAFIDLQEALNELGPRHEPHAPQPVPAESAHPDADQPRTPEAVPGTGAAGTDESGVPLLPTAA